MKVMGEKGIGGMLKTFLQICLYTGILILIVLPFGLNAFGYKLGASMFVIYPNGIVLLIITHKFIQLFDSLKNKTPFCLENVKILKRTSIVALIGSAFWLLDLMYEIFLAKSEDLIFNSTLFFLFILFFGVAIALYILSELFKEAYEYKKENELTI